jgi:hypothetical protein
MKSTMKRGPGGTTPPALYEHEDYGIIVFMHSLRKGSVMGNACAEYPLGTYKEFWNMNEFKVFDGSLILENE